MILGEKKRVKIYTCEPCHFSCQYQSDWDRHLRARRHNSIKLNEYSMILGEKNESLETMVSEKKEDSPQCHHNYVCKNCSKHFKTYNSLWYHTNKSKIKCVPLGNNHTNESNQTNSIVAKHIDKNIMIDTFTMLIQQNQEFKQMMFEQNNKIMEISKSNMISNTTINGNINNKFNINVFLNEQCKDAMNLMDFVKNIQITNADIENNGQLGFVGGISKIFLDNLKQLSIFERPIHCTDVKRETMYIKSDDKWQKEEDKTKLQKAITEISRKSVAKINQWKTETPEYDNMDSPEFMRGITMSNNSMAGHNRENYADKIIRILAKETMVDKQNLLL